MTAPVPTVANLLAGVPFALPNELAESLLAAPGFRLERIVSQGHASPADFWYDQPTPEWVLLVSGSADLEFEGHPPTPLRPGDHLLIPAHTRHRVARTHPTDPTVWLALHYAPDRTSAPTIP